MGSLDFPILVDVFFLFLLGKQEPFKEQFLLEKCLKHGSMTLFLMWFVKLDLFFSLVLGNGVVIHLPGLFEEAQKNFQKGKGKVF